MGKLCSSESISGIGGPRGHGVSDGGVVDNTTFWHAMLTKDGSLHHEPNPPLLLLSCSVWYRYEFLTYLVWQV